MIALALSSVVCCLLICLHFVSFIGCFVICFATIDYVDLFSCIVTVDCVIFCVFCVGIAGGFFFSVDTYGCLVLV